MRRNCFNVLTMLVVLLTLTTSCQKETIVRSPTNMELIGGKWNTLHHEFETYSSGVLISKKIEYFTGFYLELNSGAKYAVKNQEGVTSGKWELASSNRLVLDKNTAGERYFYILLLEPKTLILRGPFKKNGELKLNYLATTYYQKP